MSKGKKKSSKQEKALQTIILLTAIFNLMETLIDLLKELLHEENRGGKPPPT